MGFELNRIMKQYGVGTPGMATYTGTAAPVIPTAPTGERPTGEDDAAKAVYDKQLADANAYKADPAAFNEQMRKYGLDQKSYDTYKTGYQNRLQNTPMYVQSQFDTGNRPVSDAMKYATNTTKNEVTGQGMGADKFYANTRQYVENNPYASTQANQDYLKKYGISNQDVYNATGSYYGNQLKNPTYGAVNASMINDAPQAKSDYYLQQRNLGYTDADLRDATTASFGKPNEGDWAQLTARAYPHYNANIVDAYKSIGRSWDAGTIDAPGYNYWMNQLSSGAFNPKDLNSTFAAIAADEKRKTVQSVAEDALKFADGGSVHDLAAQYAVGGSVLNPSTGDSDYAKFMMQQQRRGAPTQFAEPPPDYDKIVQDAYGTLQGRTGIGTEANNIDQGGFDYWKSQLASGAIKPENFRGAFSSATDQYMANNPEDKYTKQVQGFMPTHIANLYREVLGRAPDTGGAAYWAKQFGDEVNADEMNTFIQAAQPEIATRYTSSPFNRNVAVSNNVSGSTGGGGNNVINKLVDFGTNTVLSRAIGPVYDYANAGRQILQGNIPGAATSLVSGLTGGVSNVAKGIGRVFRFEEGGPVKTHYQTAGTVRLPSGYISPEEEADTNQRFRSFRDTQPEAVSTPVNMVVPPPPVIIEPQVVAPAPVAAAPKSVLTEIAAKNIKADPMPAAPAADVAPVAPAALPFGGERLAGIQALLATYGPKDSAYAADLKAARTSAKAESDAFANMLKTAMNSPEDAQSSKAEMYFRLAAAFGAPTKTGQFSENLGMVGKELGEYAKGKRASAREKLALGLEAQKLKMASAKEDLNTLRALTGEEMKDKRAIATELIKDYIKSGEPQSAAGKQALDEGFKPGTPEYQKRVAEVGNLNVEAKMTQITAALSNISTQAASLAVTQSRLDLDRERLQNQKTQQAKLTGPELKLKVEAEDLIASSKQSLLDLKQAYALNPNSLAGGWLDKGQQFLSEAAGSKDPVIVNTRVLNNLLGSQGLAKLRATFGGSPTEGERAILLELEGIGAKTKDERGQIIKRAYKVLQDRQAREQARLDQINSGAYRSTAPLEGGTD